MISGTGIPLVVLIRKFYVIIASDRAWNSYVCMRTWHVTIPVRLNICMKGLCYACFSIEATHGIWKLTHMKSAEPHTHRLDRAFTTETHM